MSLLGKLGDIVGGSLFKEVKDTVMAYYPPDMTDQEKAKAELELTKVLHEKEIATNNALQEAAQELDRRVAEQEGTAKDLMALGIIGKPIVFLRGVQRPLWGFAVMYFDNKWFFSADKFSEQQQTALIVINVLVLGFLFGERTVKNLEPLIVKVFGKG